MPNKETIQDIFSKAGTKWTKLDAMVKSGTKSGTVPVKPK